MNKGNILETGIFECTGCSACGVICPTKCISFSENKSGFISPIVDLDKCINCGICKEVCYKYFNTHNLERNAYNNNTKVYGVINNYIKQLSDVTTVGIATVIADFYFKKNKNIVGVDFDPIQNKCFHKIAISENDINSFAGSKYLQSSNYESFDNIIHSNKESIVFGTPCQIYGLRQIIKKQKIEDKFCLIDIYCAGVPSKNLWISYTKHLDKYFSIKSKEIKSVRFRDKSQGWHKFSMNITTESVSYKQNLYNDIFFNFFIKKLCQNKSCYNCIFRHKYIASDIRLGDFWGEKYQIFDDGVELMLLNTEKGRILWEQIKHFFRYEECSVEDIYKSQKFDEIEMPQYYDKIINSLANGEDIDKILKKINDGTYSL